ncbi:hypothetical protein GCM10010347_01880 [Streptomyces cirratus]|uniref:Uncharacterized protein n=1 Tax=Streptomyces cirratus TaxID=68187 RepID=A0ABQ3EII7_9ACTN|nr:hypothetical protein GCM10010347_01880 [Streptomyces cirratus]
MDTVDTLPFVGGWAVRVTGDDASMTQRRRPGNKNAFSDNFRASLP